MTTKTRFRVDAYPLDYVEHFMTFEDAVDFAESMNSPAYKITKVVITHEVVKQVGPDLDMEDDPYASH